MEFRDILRSLDQLDEATKEVKGGRVHTAEPGGYGRQDDDDEDEDGKKIKTDKPAGEKRGRGRPPKEVSTRTSTGADAGNKKYSSDSLQKAMGIGKPSGKAKVTTKHKTSDKEPVGESMSLKGWFDKLDKGFYPHVYIIMTTNKSINYFDELDKSYMRNNRVNLKAELQTDKTFVIL